MYLFRLLVASVLLGSLVVSCTTGGDQQNIPLNLEGRWSEATLADDTINVVKQFSDRIFAATTKGLLSQPLSAINNQPWNTRGLEDQEIIDFVVLSDQKILAGIKLPTIESKQNSLFLTTNNGNEWTPYQQNFGGENHYNWLTALTRHPSDPSILYAKGGALNVVQSTDMGKSWQLVNGSWEPSLGFSLFLSINTNNPETIWAGGSNSIFEPQLIKSTDGGDSWQQITVLENIETTVYDVAVHPSDEHTVLAGLGIGIRKSTDGGQHWTTTFQEAGIYTLTHSARNPRIIYAAGATQEGTLAFFASGDFGDTWQQVKLPNSPTDILVNDMISVMNDGQEVLYFGTTEGIYRYTFEE